MVKDDEPHEIYNAVEKHFRLEFILLNQLQT